MTLPRSGPRASLALLAATLACGAGERGGEGAASRRPAAEFLLSAGDSTFWIATDSARVRVRSSPMLIAHYGGRTYEIYATDDDRSYHDAVFASQRIYRRDLLGGDSTAVAVDSLVPALARRYGDAHPHETPLAPDDDTAERPHTSAIADVSLVDVHGPYLTYDAFADVDGAGIAERHSTRRVVIDLRSATTVSLAALFGRPAADSLAAAGRVALGRALDSVQTLARGGSADDEAGVRALHALPSFRFAADNFGLANDGPRPAVTFVAVGRDVDGHDVTLSLPPIAVPGAAPAWWSTDVAQTLPVATHDTSRWTLDSADVIARPSGTETTAALVLRARTRRDAARAEWPLARVPAPVRQLYSLDRARLDAGGRRALTRAFNESAQYGADAISASNARRALASRLSRVTYRPPPSSPRAQRGTTR